MKKPYVVAHSKKTPHTSAFRYQMPFQLVILQDIKESTHDSFGLLLQEIMIRTLQPNKCVVIFIDDSYLHVFDIRWFKRFGFLLTFIVIKVNEYDDLYAPEPEIQFSLLNSKLNGCQLYIILISNGIQMRRLLKYCDRNRAISTLSKYILLYDNRLFHKEMIYLWKKLINVVFIKTHNGKRTEDENEFIWFEIATVPFPLPTTNTLLLKRLDIWTQSKFRKGNDLFKDKTIDLQNQTLKVVAFAHLPGIQKINSTKTLRNALQNTEYNETIYFTGTEIGILQTMSQWMNFQVKIYEPENIETELWGRNLITGTYTGIIGEIVNTEADIALGELYYTPYLLDLMDLTIPYNTECLTFITPEALTDNSWKTLILPFKPILWTGVLVSLVVTILCFYYLSNFYATTTSIERNSEDTLCTINSSLKHRKVITVSINPNPEKINENEKYTLMREKYQQSKQEEPNGLYQFSEPINSALYTYSMLLLVSLPKLPTGWSLRLLTGWYWLYCLLVVTAYRASMTAILARPSIAVKIDTIEQLIKSRLTYAGWGEINEHFFKTSADPSLEIISDNFVLVNDSEEAVDRVAEGSFAFYENTYFLKEALVKRQRRFQKQFSTNENSTNQSENLVNVKNDRILHIMEDCIIKMPISIGLQKNSPLKPRIDKFIRQVSEAGFIEKWLDDVMQKVYTTEIQIEDSGTTKAIMNLRKFSGALVALVFGYLVALIVLMAENIYFYLVVSKHPHFNKYTKQIVTKSN
ncbi:uncharacterized protein LOC130446737 isoform X1 [Diorhabda sublineata]|uniref:uncharacterized protein LOC130446737 isoform X1 n=1 Tax=Diorhabda sublineata TaxID=1163346 RepID=UPI0024E0A852|nr:uncharacterized protein LOC130446737 isoform X1 [Diorhabda sublineata]